MNFTLGSALGDRYEPDSVLNRLVFRNFTLSFAAGVILPSHAFRSFTLRFIPRILC